MATIITVIDPRHLEFVQWANEIRLQNKSIPAARSAETWKDWARQVVQIDRDAPYPDRFTDWRSWAVLWMATV